MGKPNRAEVEFIKQITQAYKGLPLVENNIDKADFFGYVNDILPQLNAALLARYSTCLGGGSLIALKHQQLRYTQIESFNQLIQ